MRKPIVAFLALPLILGISQVRAAEPARLTPTQVARLESLCRVWGVVKFFHPWIVAPPDGKSIDWDAALVKTIPRVEAASSSEEFRRAIDHLFAALHDPATRAVIPGSQQGAAKQQAAKPRLPETKIVEGGGKKILVITATDWPSLAADRKKTSGGLFTKAFAEAAGSDAIVLDLRRRDTPPDFYDGAAEIINSALREDIAALLKVDLRLAALRRRFHSGYAPERGPPSGGYHSGFSIAEHEVIQAKPGASAGKRLVIMTNDGARTVANDLLAALQAPGQAIVLHDSIGVQDFAGDTYRMYPGDGIVATVRTADSVNVDGTIGFTPDITNAADKGKAGDPLFDKALAVARGEIRPPTRLSARPACGPLRITENSYPDMASPSREYRLLGLFRVWNVMNYFFPYQHLMDRSWDSVLTEFIPRFAEAATPEDYCATAREFVAHLQDSHVFASGGIADAAFTRRFGGRSLIITRFIGGDLVVVAADASVKDRLKIGDVVLEVDGESIAERMARVKKYYAASTPQSLQTQVRSPLLSGPPGSLAKLKVRSPSGTLREEIVPRPVFSRPAWMAFVESNHRKTPVFSVLPEGYGYFDLVRLTTAQLDEAFKSIKDTPALIMDMRGYPLGTAWAICARLTDKPMTMAMIRIPYLTSPGSWGVTQNRYSFLQRIEPSPLSKYARRVVVLINEEAISQSEHSCLGFEEAAKGRITFIGTPTHGANGNVTFTSMPGGISVRFTGMDVCHADGRQLQRKGIQPDIVAEPTIADIVAGKDEVLEAAIRFLNQSKGK